MLLGLVVLATGLWTEPLGVIAADSISTFIAEADAPVVEATPGANAATAALRADGGSDPDVESYLRFAVSGVMPHVLEATLRVYASTGTVDGPAVYGTTSSWIEAAITWNNRPARVGAALDDVAGIASATWVDYDLTALVTGDGSVDVVLATTSTDGVDFHSREGAQKPQLVVRSSATPADTTAPTAPTAVTASAVSATDVDVSWSGATDDIGVTGYEIYRNDAWLATLGPSTTFTDRTTWSTSSFTYAIRARDAAGNRSAPSVSATVTTPAGDGPSLLAAGDIATCGQYGHEATAALLDGQSGVVAAVGDLAYPSGTAAEFRDCYGPSWGRHLARTRPAPGNHEYQSAGAAPYFDYFGPAAGDRTKGYYSYDLGTWHVVVLNSNCAAVLGCHTGSPQEQWLRADLAANPDQCTVAYWHHPMFSSGNHGGEALMEPFWQALYEAGADVVLSGHDHIYERFAPQAYNGASDPSFGIRQFVVGTGGRDSDRFVRPPAANSEITEIATFGILRLELNAGSYTWSFLPEAGRTFSDAGTGTCHGIPTGPPPAEITPPTVTARNPGANATNVPIICTVTATFDEPVTGVSGTTFTLEGPGATPVTSTVSYDGASRTATLVPSAALADGTTYTARLTSGITDTSPNANALIPLSWTFATAAAAPPSSGIVIRTASSGDNLSATSLVLPRPAGVVEGDVLLAAVAARGTPTISPPVGWTLVRLDANGSTVRQAIFVRVAGQGEPASYTFGLSTAQSAAGGIVAYVGVDPANPVDVAGGQVNPTSTSITAPSVTTTGPDRMLVGFAAIATLTSGTPPVGMIERYDETVPATNTYKITAAAAEQLLTGAGATGPRVTTTANAATSVGQLVALRPGGSPGPTPTPTPGPTPTPTPGPTPTPTPGPTPTPTPTPGPTPTPTPTPSSLTFGAAADARVEEARASNNYGTSTYLRTDGGSDSDVESYLRFTVTGISGQVRSATLRVFASAGSVDGPAAYATTSGWTETGITWSNRPARTGGALADRGSISSGSWVEYDVTAAVIGNGNVSLVLATMSSDGVDVRAREYKTIAQRPQLVVTFQP